MNTASLFIDGMDTLEILSFTKELKEKQIEYQKLTKAEATNETGKAFEFVSTTVVVIGASQVAITIFRWWWKNRRRAMGKGELPKLSVKLPNGTTVKFADDGKIESVLEADGTLIESSQEQDSKETIDEHISAFSELIKAVQDLLKEIIGIQS